MWKNFLAEYFNFTRKERKGVFVLLAIIFICFCIPFFYPFFIHHKIYDHTQFEREIATLQNQQVDTSSQRNYAKNFDTENFNNDRDPPAKKFYPRPNAEVFYFDPNLTSVSEWQRLGIRDKTIATIQKYLQKGGHFYKPEDLSKIWGLHADDVNRLLPYVKIADTRRAFSSNFERKNEFKTGKYVKETATGKSIDINLADTSEFIALQGIGSKLAQRIVNFREKLGGFYSVQQVGQTFGLPDSTFQKIRTKLMISNAALKKININTSTVDELKVHPYIRYVLANAIVQYRSQHGNFSSVSDIKNIMLINDEVFNKVSPYLVTQD